MEKMIKKLRIGNVVLDNNLILAPMAGACHFVCCAGNRERDWCVRRW